MLLLTGIFVAYFLFLVVLLAGWNRAAQARRDAGTGREPLISVIIPARNEETTIGTLLTSLFHQEYKNFEIIVVNDDSEDETLWTVTRFEKKNLRAMHNKGKGKKAALATGVRAAKGAIIVTTDADCTVSPQWLKALREPFRDPVVMMAFGGVRMEGDDTFFDKLQAIEFSSLVGSGAATAALNLPTMCNGANLAFRKKAFSAVEGYDDNIGIPSGDDEFLMRKIRARFPKSVRFVSDEGAVVTTRSQPDYEAFVNQRLRWASKWRFNTSPTAKMLAVLVVLFQCAFLVNWGLIFTSFILQALFLLSVKMILEAAFLLQVCRFHRMPWNWLAFFALQVLYPVYVIGISAASFFRPFRWKNRIFRPI